MSLLDSPLTYNERLLVELVFRHTPISRADLAGRTGLTPATVTRLVARLIEIGLLVETVERSGAIGQPPRHLAIAPGKAYSVGINFIRHRFDMALVDLAGTVVDIQHSEIAEVTPASVADLAVSTLDGLLARSGIARGSLIGAGLSLPGGFAPDGASLRAHDYFQALDGVNMQPILEAALGLFCAVETDGGCAAIGEFLYGEGVRVDTFFCIHVGHGVGGGAIIDGRLYRGPHGNASKPGVLFPYDTPRPSGQDLVETLRRAGAPVDDISDIEAVAQRYAGVIEAWLDRAATQLAQVVRVATAFIDPQLVVVGGRLPTEMNRQLVDRIARTEMAPPSRGLPVAPVRASALGPRSGVLGAASVPVFAGFFPGSIDSFHDPYVNGRRLPARGGEAPRA